MMRLRIGLVLAVVAVIVSGAHSLDAATVTTDTYDPTWESLDQHQTPQWFQDAKLGVFMYGPCPTETYWDTFWTSQGQPGKPYSQSGYGYRSVDQMTWDPNKIAQFVEDIGAKYIVWSGDSASNFLTFPSAYADIPGSAFTTVSGPGSSEPDYTGQLATAMRARGLKIGLYRNYLYPADNPYFLDTMHEMIDRYKPDTLWLDQDWPFYTSDQMQSKELFAYYYNNADDPAEVAAQDSVGTESLAGGGTRLIHGDFYRKEMLTPASEFSDGYFERYERFRPYQAYTRNPTGQSGSNVNNFIEWLAHSTSHGGNMVIAMDSASDAVFDWFRQELLPIGDWMDQNGQAIYDTRPWYAGVPEMQTGDGIATRFTTKRDTLYAILFDEPGQQVFFPGMSVGPNTEVSILGLPDTLAWQQTSSGLTVTIPPSLLTGGTAEDPGLPGDHAHTLRFAPASSTHVPRGFMEAFDGPIYGTGSVQSAFWKLGQTGQEVIKVASFGFGGTQGVQQQATTAWGDAERATGLGIEPFTFSVKLHEQAGDTGLTRLGAHVQNTSVVKSPGDAWLGFEDDNNNLSWYFRHRDTTNTIIADLAGTFAVDDDTWYEIEFSATPVGDGEWTVSLRHRTYAGLVPDDWVVDLEPSIWSPELGWIPNLVFLFAIGNSPNTVMDDVMIIPEPATMMMIAAGGIIMFRRRRRAAPVYSSQ